jgi:DNA-binding transcriptional ArsR family regulator
MESKVGTSAAVAGIRELSHPDRMRAFSTLTRRAMSRIELQAELPDVPATTLYRHLARLLDAGLIQIVEARPIGANRELVYEALPLDLTPDESGQLTPEDYIGLVTSLASDLLGTVQRVAVSKRGLVGRSTFGMQVFFATDAEHRQILKRFDAFLAELDNEFPPGRRRVQRSLTYGMCPRA